MNERYRRAGVLTFAAVLFSLIATPQAVPITVTGIVSDATCAADHRGRITDDCVRACTEESVQYALVVGSRVYVLVGEDDIKEQLYNLAAQTVTVTGDRIPGDVIVVASVMPGEAK
jgi:hypothetical protein